ncbi:hypothetical protein [Neobacillus vireti]|nr:hypothetical protein [Neobacillus vireti]
MSTQKKPLLTDEFLDELAKEISQLYGDPEYENRGMPVRQDKKI